jgi:hypothetical protein
VSRARSRAVAPRAPSPREIRWRRKAHDNHEFRAAASAEGKTVARSEHAWPPACVVLRVSSRAQDALELRHGERVVCAETTACAFARDRRRCAPTAYRRSKTEVVFDGPCGPWSVEKH